MVLGQKTSQFLRHFENNHPDDIKSGNSVEMKSAEASIEKSWRLPFTKSSEKLKTFCETFCEKIIKGKKTTQVST